MITLAPATTILNGHRPPMTPTIQAVPIPIPAPFLPPATATTTPHAKVRRDWGNIFQTFLTAAAAGIAMAGSGQSMWKFTEHVLHITNLGARGAIFAVFEIALISCAVRARRYRVKYRQSSGAERAVWIIAVVVGCLVATDETSLPAAAMRFSLPVLAAYLFHQLILDQAKDAADDTAPKRTWRISPTRIMVKLGLWDASARDVADVDLTRRMALLATLRYQLDQTPASRRRTRAQRRYQKAVAKANELYGLATHPTAMDKFLASVALLHGAVTASTAEAVSSASPWTRAAVRAEKDLGARGRTAAVRPPTATPASVPTQPRARFVPSREKARHRPVGETLAEYEALRAANPDQSQPWYAARLGITPRHLLNIRRSEGSS